jgi:uncharacterized protein YgiM (DUF1202 family)
MKPNRWLLCGLAGMAAAAVLAQDSKAPASARKEPGVLAKDVVLDPPATATVTQEALNVRAQPSFAGEVVAHVSRGQTVTVLEQITLGKPKLNEPKDWSRIALPTNAAAWVFADYVDSKTMTVSALHLSVRGGPGENYSRLAVLEKGTPVKEVRRAKGWIQIEPPPNAYGFVASEYLTLQAPAAPAPAALAAVEPAAITPIAAAAPEPVAPPVAAPPPPPEPVAPVPTNSTPPVAAVPVAAVPVAAEAAPASPPPAEPAVASAKPRIVTREGFVRKALNIQAPTDYGLYDIQSGELTEYLQPNDKKFKMYLGTRVSVTGPELLDQRWPKTPILQVQTVDLMP